MLIPIDARSVILSLMPQGGVGAEIGVHMAEFSRQILRHASPRKLYLIDPWKHFEGAQYERSKYGGLGVDGQTEMDNRFETVQRKLRRPVNSGTVEIVRAFSGEAAGRFGPEDLDFVYVDGDHSYEGVRADLDAYFPLVKVGGLIILDDYAIGNWWHDGVVRATHELLARASCKVTFQMDNQIAIQKLG